MLPDRIPPELVDDILSRLEIRDLLALSYTCKALRVSANRALYANYSQKLAAGEVRDPNMVDESLKLNPSNAQYLCTYRSTSFETFEVIAPELQHLERLCLAWESSKAIDERLPTLHSKFRPNTRIDHLLCEGPYFNLTHWGLIFSELSNFPGLRRLSISSNCNLPGASLAQTFVELIECPQLEQLSFIDVEMGPVNLKSARLPNLRAMHYHYTSVTGVPPFHEELGVTQQVWKRAKALKAGGVHLCITVLREEGFFDRTLWLAEAAVEYGGGGSSANADLEWLVRGSEYAQTQIYDMTTVTLDIKGTEEAIRDRVLRVVSGMKFQYPVGCRISVYASDTNSYYLRDEEEHHSSLLDAIPQFTTEVYLSVKESIHTRFIPLVIRALPELESIVIFIPCRLKPRKSSAATDVNGFEARLPEELCEGAVWCTRYGFLVRPSKEYGGRSIELELRSDGSTTWWATEDISLKRERRFEEKLEEEADEMNANILNEVDRWFRFSPSLRRVRWRFRERGQKFSVVGDRLCL